MKPAIIVRLLLKAGLTGSESVGDGLVDDLPGLWRAKHWVCLTVMAQVHHRLLNC